MRTELHGIQARLVALKKKHGWFNHTLALKIGVDTGTVQHWIAGTHYPRREHQVRIFEIEIGRRFNR